MQSQYKNGDLLKIQPFYSEEIKSNNKKTKKKRIYLDYHRLIKN